MDSYAKFTKSFTISVTPETVKKLDRMRRHGRQSRAALVRQLIDEALAAREASGPKANPPVR